jgi:hypothetical protein
VIQVVKFYHPVLLSPLEVQSWVVEDTLQTALFVFNPLLRIYMSDYAVPVHFKLTHTLDLGFGDDPLWSGTDTYTMVDEDIPPLAIRDYAIAAQLDKVLPPQPVTRYTVYLTNTSTTTDMVVKTILFGQTETQIQNSRNQGVITTIH